MDEMFEMVTVFLVIVFVGGLCAWAGYAAGVQSPSEAVKIKVVCDYLEADVKDDVCIKNGKVIELDFKEKQ